MSTDKTSVSSVCKHCHLKDVKEDVREDLKLKLPSIVLLHPIDSNPVHPSTSSQHENMRPEEEESDNPGTTFLNVAMNPRRVFKTIKLVGISDNSAGTAPLKTVRFVTVEDDPGGAFVHTAGSDSRKFTSVDKNQEQGTTALPKTVRLVDAETNRCCTVEDIISQFTTSGIVPSKILKLVEVNDEVDDTFENIINDSVAAFRTVRIVDKDTKEDCSFKKILTDWKNPDVPLKTVDLVEVDDCPDDAFQSSELSSRNPEVPFKTVKILEVRDPPCFNAETNSLDPGIYYRASENHTASWMGLKVVEVNKNPDVAIQSVVNGPIVWENEDESRESYDSASHFQTARQEDVTNNLPVTFGKVLTYSASAPKKVGQFLNSASPCKPELPCKLVSPLKRAEQTQTSIDGDSREANVQDERHKCSPLLSPPKKFKLCHESAVCDDEEVLYVKSVNGPKTIEISDEDDEVIPVGDNLPKKSSKHKSTDMENSCAPEIREVKQEPVDASDANTKSSCQFNENGIPNICNSGESLEDAWCSIDKCWILKRAAEYCLVKTHASKLVRMKRIQRFYNSDDIPLKSKIDVDPKIQLLLRQNYALIRADNSPTTYQEIYKRVTKREYSCPSVPLIKCVYFRKDKVSGKWTIQFEGLMERENTVLRNRLRLPFKRIIVRRVPSSNGQSEAISPVKKTGGLYEILTLFVTGLPEDNYLNALENNDTPSESYIALHDSVNTNEFSASNIQDNGLSKSGSPIINNESLLDRSVKFAELSGYTSEESGRSSSPTYSEIVDDDRVKSSTPSCSKASSPITSGDSTGTSDAMSEKCKTENKPAREPSTNNISKSQKCSDKSSDETSWVKYNTRSNSVGNSGYSLRNSPQKKTDTPVSRLKKHVKNAITSTANKKQQISNEKNISNYLDWNNSDCNLPSNENNVLNGSTASRHQGATDSKVTPAKVPVQMSSHHGDRVQQRFSEPEKILTRSSSESNNSEEPRKSTHENGSCTVRCSKCGTEVGI